MRKQCEVLVLTSLLSAYMCACTQLLQCHFYLESALDSMVPVLTLAETVLAASILLLLAQMGGKEFTRHGR